MATQATQASIRNVVSAQGETKLWHSQAHMPTVKHSERVIVRGEGAYIWTEDGHRLLDLPASLWYCNVGHGRRRIAEAVAEQMSKIEAYSTFQRYATPPALELAARVAAMAPVDDARVCLTSGGSDSVELAGKLVRRYWDVMGRPDKRIIVTRREGYHGLHGIGTSIAGIDVNREGYGELIRETARIDNDNPESLQALIHERGADTIGAVFCEPVIGTGGVFYPKPGYLQSIQALCREHDILFVADEVITGFGRTGEMFACERYDLRPDMLLVAKGISSGYLPLGAVIVAHRLWEPFWADDSELTFRHGLTYAGHATACAAALANLDILEEEELVGRVAMLEGSVEAALRPLESHPLVREVRAGVGLLAAVELHDRAAAAEVAELMVDNGVLGRQLNDGAIHISPPFVITEHELAVVAEVIADALDQAQRSHTRAV
jgi:putrescine aminotransferase